MFHPTHPPAHHHLLKLVVGISLVTLTGSGVYSFASGAAIAQLPSPAPTRPAKPNLLYVPTPPAVVEQMLKVAGVTANDLVYDLGSGDGRIVIAAARDFGARAVGVELNPKLVEESRENAQKAGVAERVKFLQEDIFDTDIRNATVVALYLFPDVMTALKPKFFRELKPGTRIVSQTFSIAGWRPTQVVKAPTGQEIFLWIVPPAGTPAPR